MWMGLTPCNIRPGRGASQGALSGCAGGAGSVRMAGRVALDLALDFVMARRSAQRRRRINPAR